MRTSRFPLVALVTLALALAACGFRHGAANGNGDGGLPIDGPGSNNPDAPDAAIPPDAPTCESIASLGVNLCPSSAPLASIDVTTDEVLDTGPGTAVPTDPELACATVASPMPAKVCVLYAQTITIDAGHTLFVKGANALVLFATGTIDIEGTIDASSEVGGSPGPGPAAAGCQYGRGATGAGGGQGGSFGSAGGNGGDQDAAANTSGLAGLALASVSTLERGCDGKDGAGSGGSHGAGGGVVLLAAPQLTVGDAGAIDTSGASGKGGGAGRHGGGGAGAGGMIVIDAAILSDSGNGQIFANGGGGGGGSSSTAGSPGIDSTDAGTGGTGGPSGGSGGDGGDGAFLATPAEDGNPGTNNGDGGGGGGGGLGFILVHTSTNLGGLSNISPAPTSI